MKIPLIVAHRGLPYEAVENTIESFVIAFDSGADFIEGDFWLTYDEEIVCIHDKNTARITKGKAKYDITKTTFNQLRQINYFDIDFNQKFIIPTFDEIIKIIPEGKGIFVEIKDNRQKFVDILKTKLSSLNFSKSFIRIISYHPDILKYFKRIIPEIKTYWIFDSFFMRSKCKNAVIFNRFYQTLKEISCDGVVLNLEANLDENNFKRFHDLKLEISVYGVNDQNSTRKLIESGIDYINTDYTKMVRAIIQDYTKLNNQS